MTIRNTEVISVGPDEMMVTFTTEAPRAVVTRVGGEEVSTTGVHHVAHVTGLAPDTEYDVRIEGFAGTDQHLPPRVRTLERPLGRLLATVATVNDVHFGEEECGRLGVDDEPGPILRAEPGEPPYPETMNRAAIAEIDALDPDAVVVKGDLTNRGTESEYQAFLDAYSTLGDKLHHVRGNHDAMIDPTMARNDAPFVREVGGVALAVLDTVTPGIDRGRLPSEQIAWLDDLAAAHAGPVLAFGHHHLWDLDADHRSQTYFGINPDDSEALAAVVARRENIVGYFAGHTHKHRVRRFGRVRDVPFVEVGCTKDYPGMWAEYRVYAGGYTQVARRMTAPAALDWTERTRGMYADLYRDYALGSLEQRCFTETW